MPPTQPPNRVYLSEHFCLEEFTKLNHHDIPTYTLGLLEDLCKAILEPLRAFLGCSIRITSGLRTPADTARLRAAGYHPSDTSDHYAGMAVPATSAATQRAFGAVYWASTGAADIVPIRGALWAWERLLPLLRPDGAILLPAGEIRVGQLIMEGGWLHVSNPVSAILQPRYARMRKVAPFLISEDGGATYRSAL